MGLMGRLSAPECPPAARRPPPPEHRTNV